MKQTMLLILIFILIFQYCDTTEPPQSKATLTLELEDVSCTEAWLKLTTTNLPLPTSLNLLKNNAVSQVFILNTQDSILYIDSLLPKQTYSFQVSSIQHPVSSNKANATTMDTTSHNFTWQSWTFGQHSSSVLYDVAIINENNIWAVGEIYMNDSLGNPDPHAYNAIHWNGVSWELKRVPFFYNGSPIFVVIKSVFAFREDDIWFEAGIHWNGSNFEQIPMNVSFPSHVNKLWGSSSNDLYAVGNGGNIAHYNGSSWTKIESGTSMNLFDISSSDGKSIYISGGNFNMLEGILLLGNSSGFKMLKEGKNISAAEIFKPYFAGISKTVWMSYKRTVFWGGNFLYRYKLGMIDFVKSLPGNYFNQNSNGENWGFISMIRGNSDNDLIMIGEGNTVRHFNGFTWEQLGMPYNYNSDYTWLAVEVKANIIASVGRSNASAILILLQR